MRSDARQRAPSGQALSGTDGLRVLATSRTGREILARDWAGTPLGPIEAWPVSLRTTLATMLACPAPMYLAWGDDLVSFFNDAYRPVLGDRVEAALGARFHELWADLWADLEPLCRRALAGEGVAQRDLMLPMIRDGTPAETWWTFTYSPVHDDSGAVAGMLCITSETTAQVVAERERRASEARLELALSAGDGIGTWDWSVPDDRVTADARFARLYGVDPEVAAAGAPVAAFFQRIHPDDLPGVRTAIAEALRTGGEFAAEYRLVRPDAVRWVAAQGRCILAADGSPARFPGVSFDVTERRSASEALVAGEARLRAIFDAVPTGLLFAETPSGRIVEANARVAQILRHPMIETPDIASYVRWIAFHADGSRVRAEEFPLARTILTGEPATAEVLYQRGDGTLGWVRLASAPIREGRDGRMTGAVVAVVDIDARRRAEEGLRAREKELRLIADALPSLISFIDTSLTYRFANAAYEVWFDRPLDQVVGHTVREIIGEANFTPRRHHLDAALAGREAHFEIEWPHPDGRHRIADIRYIPRRDAEDRVDGLYAFVQDITDRKRVEIALAEEVAARTRERNRLWETTTDLMATAGLDGFLKTVNPAWTRALGWSRDELLARPFYAIIDEADHAETGAVVARLAAGETVEGFVDRVIRKDGERLTVSWNAVPEGAQFYIVGRDITEQRQVEELLHQSQKIEAVGQLTGGIAHDFNNLLTGIVGSLDLMQTRIRQGRTDQIEKYAAAALSSANRAAALTHRLLAFARRQPLEPKPTNANTLAAGMEDLLRRTLSERVNLEIVTAGGLWLTLCDPHQLESAILNLAINARDAMLEGGRLVIETSNTHLDHAYGRLHPSVRPGQYVCVSVTDTGSGMSPEVAAKAFDPFFTTKPMGQGTGLGLSMIYGFAKQSEGHAKIYSEPGKGSTIKLYLPRYHGGTVQETTPAEADPGPRAEHGETVLVVEDEAVVRDLILEVLHDLGYRTLEAVDGPAGLAILASPVPIDLLITDVGLPGLDGRAMVERSRATRPDLKVLFITGYAENAMFGRAGFEPGTQLITKPFPVETLATRIREIIAR